MLVANEWKQGWMMQRLKLDYSSERDVTSVKLMRFCVLPLIAVVLLGCVTTGDRQTTSAYPAELSGVGDSPSFPLQVGPFRRGDITVYAPDFADFSISYNLNEPDRKAAVTVYMTAVDFVAREGLDTEESYFAASKAGVLGAHPKAHLLEESRVEVAQDVGTLAGVRAVYSFEAVFAGRKQEVQSELYVFRHGDRFIKFRQTYPVRYAPAVTNELRRLMTLLQWSNVEYRPLPGQSASTLFVPFKAPTLSAHLARFDGLSMAARTTGEYPNVGSTTHITL